LRGAGRRRRLLLYFEITTFSLADNKREREKRNENEKNEKKIVKKKAKLFLSFLSLSLF